MRVERDDYRNIGAFQCGVLSVHYDVPTRSGYLMMADGHCCDMSGCIREFERIDPDVVRIATFSGEAEDTQYHKRPAGWVAYRAPERRRAVP